VSPWSTYLNGQFATQSNWRRVIAELGGWRHITYDERARDVAVRLLFGTHPPGHAERFS
jgi:hypothetical protein